jgi:hypothetical protein
MVFGSSGEEKDKDSESSSFDDNEIFGVDPPIFEENQTKTFSNKHRGGSEFERWENE